MFTMSQFWLSSVLILIVLGSFETARSETSANPYDLTSGSLESVASGFSDDSSESDSFRSAEVIS